MKECLVLTILLIQAQDSNNFKTREYATASLECLAYVYDIRPALNEAIANNKNGLEIRRRCERVGEFVVELYLEDMKYRQVPDMPTQTAWYVKGNPKVIYRSYEVASSVAIGTKGSWDANEIVSVEIPLTVSDFITAGRTEEIRDGDILKQLEDKINGKSTNKSGRGIITTPEPPWYGRLNNISRDAGRIYTNLLPSWARPISKK
jgi:hypothetical protein